MGNMVARLWEGFKPKWDHGDGEGKIYIIRSSSSDRVYVGSTRGSLERRIAMHKAYYKAWKNGGSGFYSVFSLFGANDYAIEELECLGDINGRALRRRERFYLDRFREVAVNRRNPYRFPREWKAQKKRAIKKYRKTKVRCACGSVVSKGYLSRHRKTKKHLSKM
jgi:hypothetical protein